MSPNFDICDTPSSNLNVVNTPYLDISRNSVANTPYIAVFTSVVNTHYL